MHLPTCLPTAEHNAGRMGAAGTGAGRRQRRAAAVSVFRRAAANAAGIAGTGAGHQIGEESTYYLTPVPGGTAPLSKSRGSPPENHGNKATATLVTCGSAENLRSERAGGVNFTLESSIRLQSQKRPQQASSLASCITSTLHSFSSAMNLLAEHPVLATSRWTNILV